MKRMDVIFWMYVSSVPVGIVFSWLGFYACGSFGGLAGYVISTCGIFWFVEHLLFREERLRSQWYRRAYYKAKGWEEDETHD
ncbi:hypothetical protein A2264_01165 [candidate division WWE3 bacterium RIFOXYA2_FULL_46_9]|uniref:Uncharacterized protein n=1 Tax=candidate division WWE3 bacterium RIFOXYA2_FULL_46_9 TaxID=1802636 RepID=A0A1F4VZI6_UNCKA|nr:MAG: hypothetical protein A2264_01165 [candidate division WWE3 bacterium RIFOXYA2_FULL_46_9]